MQLTIATATAFALVYARSASAMGIYTPMSLVQCQPSLLAWHEGAPPYYLSVIPGGQPGATPLRSFEAINDMSRTWVVDIASGTVIALQLKDATGAVAYSDRVTIQASQDNACLNAAAAPAPAPAPAAPAAPPSNGASASPSPPAPASQQPATPAVSSPVTQAPRPPPASRPTGSQAAVASSSAKPSSGAIRTSVVNGFAGLLAVLGMALF